MRKIIHVDMDCFYAAIEIRDNPRYRNLPVAVGGRPEKRGVIATCNYIAREYGVHSALSSAVAKQRCADLVILPPNLKKYREVSRQIFNIFLRYTDKIETLSLDEAFLDVSESTQFHGSATYIAQSIKHSISSQLKLTASAGVSCNKFLSKVASDWEKPDGLKVISPNEVDEFVFRLPVSKIPGVGKVTSEKLKHLNIRTCGDLQNQSQEFLIERFGKFGQYLSEIARGQDSREVKSERERKSISVETTFDQDLNKFSECANQLPDLISQLSRRLARNELSRTQQKICKLFVKIKFSDFTLTSVECLADSLEIHRFYELLEMATQRKELPVRLIGLGIRFLPSLHHGYRQMELPFN